MIVVVVIGLLRPSGGTGIDASQIVIKRHQVNREKLQAREANESVNERLKD